MLFFGTLNESWASLRLENITFKIAFLDPLCKALKIRERGVT